MHVMPSIGKALPFLFNVQKREENERDFRINIMYMLGIKLRCKCGSIRSHLI